MGKRLMIIELRKYIKVRELLIGNRITGSKAQVIYRDKDHIVRVRIGNKYTDAQDNCGAIKEVLVRNKIEIE